MSARPYSNTAFNTDYKVKASNGTMGILLEGTKVLIIHRRLKNKKIREGGPPDTWSFPGGGLDPDETPEQCIVREMKEELGVDVAIQPIGDEDVWGTTDDDVDGKLWRCSIFVVKQTNAGQTVKINEPHKHVKLQWIEWKMLWAQIKAETEGRREVDESGELMRRFFPTMKNMVLKYPKREEPACLSGRLGNLP
ncbi:uncharacterized protein PpBr36_11394 [Pyricularia pennisetigena]|uniref:Nudix hydrolase domain-containing protein n=1 Tax=Pyricularia grisea TaxID=148305 RepID=A0A6P8AML2_PYRGI|nr:uncharacterized protein PpBr36_11394 [Pyricularia pennisetigena]XP_030976157.1 uncharacterized protein PgNI_12393 [Pyricularia grisea]TLD03290.1 hypothetical protein PgNI_12393 [Pyricularia grisea]TLS20339.1 hypothetical protein PpBr36_11394 [Pyricularia pennisetigena]